MSNCTVAENFVTKFRLFSDMCKYFGRKRLVETNFGRNRVVTFRLFRVFM